MMDKVLDWFFPGALTGFIQQSIAHTYCHTDESVCDKLVYSVELKVQTAGWATPTSLHVTGILSKYEGTTIKQEWHWYVKTKALAVVLQYKLHFIL